MRSCCCFLSVRKGSFVCGVYTLIFYSMLVITGAFHATTVPHTPVGFMLILILLIFSGMCIIFSMVLLIGLFLDNRLLLIPWLTVVSTTTVLDVGLSLYFITDMQINAFVVTMYITDYALCSINVYAILCVLSQYQEYTAGHRATGKKSRPALPVLSGGSNKQDPPKLNSLATWPSRTPPMPKTPSTTQNMTQASPQMGKALGDKVVPLERKPVLQMMPAIPEISNAFVCGQEDMSSSVRISTAETSLQPFAEEADHRRNDVVLDVSKLRSRTNEGRLFVPDTRQARAVTPVQITHESSEQPRLVLETCLVPRVPTTASAGDTDDLRGNPAA